VIRQTLAILRRFAWLDLAVAATPIILILGVACGKTSYAVAGGPEAQGQMPSGMEMTSVPDGQTAASGPSVVTIKGFKFGPAALTVSSGTTVTWTNSDALTHTVAATDGSFDSSNLAPGGQFSFTFNPPGTYAYHCSIHPFMTGQVIVQ